jgi:hypothetical protein
MLRAVLGILPSAMSASGERLISLSRANQRPQLEGAPSIIFLP